MATIKKTEHKRTRFLCPFQGGQECCETRCALWCDNWLGCSLSEFAIQNSVRTAVADAAVEIIQAYGDDRK